jgi:uncharacterized protein (TIGR00159 family)
MIELLISIARNLLDITLIFVAVYTLLRFLRGSRAMSVLYGLLTLGFVYITARLMDLQAFTFVVDRLAGVLLIVLVIVFQPEIRRGLARLGDQPIFQRVFKAEEEVLREVVRSAYRLATKRIGALIVLTRQSGLKGITEQSRILDAVVSTELIEAIFNPYSPIHDGALIITNNRIVAAGCVLPLTEHPHSSELGTRHRAGIGITEETDAVVLVVSEERGKVSLAYHGELIRDLSSEKLQHQLAMLMAGVGEEN